jgi:hypothetical protein
MGDHADDLINDIVDPIHDWLPERGSKEFFDDWVAGGDFEEVAASIHIYNRLKYGENCITCRSCGKQKLRWEKIGERWFLFKGKAIHLCKKNPLPLDILKALAALRRAEHRIKKLTQKPK